MYQVKVQRTGQNFTVVSTSEHQVEAELKAKNIQTHTEWVKDDVEVIEVVWKQFGDEEDLVWLWINPDLM